MRNIWNNSKKMDFNLGILIAIIMLLGVIVWSICGINRAEKIQYKQQRQELVNSIRKTVTLCYSIEGCYPPNIEYLINNYGLIVDKDKYIVHYEIFASNIAPEIEVFYIKDK